MQVGRRVVEGEGDRVVVDVPRAEVAALNAELVAAGVPVKGLVAHRRKLEEVVLAATRGSGDRPAEFSRTAGPPPSPAPDRLDDIRESA